MPTRSIRRPASREWQPTPAVPIARLIHVLARIGQRADAHDGAARFPAEDVEDLAEIGLLKAFAARPGGGGRFEDRRDFVDCLFRCLRLVGGANLSLARIFEGHVNAVALIETYGDDAGRARLNDDLEAGRLFGVWNTEPEPGVSLIREGDGWILSGSKSYATGTGSLDRAIVTARLPDGRKQMLTIPVGALPDRADPSSWRTGGMRATVSGTFDLSGLPVGPAAFVGQPDDYEREPMFTAGAWRFTAAQLGAIEALVVQLRLSLRATGRADDAVQRARFAHAVAAARTAFQWVRQAALRAEIDPAPTAPAFVLMTRGVVEDAGMAVMEAVERGIGTRAFFSDGPVDRMLRDLRLYLRQPSPDGARDRAAACWLETDCWSDDPWW